mmetsp:Transcript_18129/g.58624  ORF Transcript_18129/g.58624 Transcript_18129/m.58624 type:complete len:200 (-) Transcript_18129:354-953(-)
MRPSSASGVVAAANSWRVVSPDHMAATSVDTCACATLFTTSICCAALRPLKSPPPPPLSLAACATSLRRTLRTVTLAVVALSAASVSLTSSLFWTLLKISAAVEYTSRTSPMEVRERVSCERCLVRITCASASYTELALRRPVAAPIDTTLAIWPTAASTKAASPPPGAAAAAGASRSARATAGSSRVAITASSASVTL